MCPFALNLLLIWERADAFPGPSLDPVLVQPRPEACPRTQRKAGRTEKGKRKEAGMEQIKNRCLNTCDSAFQNGAETEPSGARPFLPLSPLRIGRTVISDPPGGRKHAAVWPSAPLLSITLPDPEGR